MDSNQIQAAKQDSRVTVMPIYFDTSAVSQAVTDAYAGMGATTGMSIGALIATLAEAEPRFGVTTI
jgi:hypothetical protein